MDLSRRRPGPEPDREVWGLAPGGIAPTVKGEPPRERDAGEKGGRPCVSVVVPFRGDEGAALRTACALRKLDLRPGDELIVADNTEDAIAAPALAGLARVVRASGEVSSYHARNAGASATVSARALISSRSKASGSA